MASKVLYGGVQIPFGRLKPTMFLLCALQSTLLDSPSLNTLFPSLALHMLGSLPRTLLLHFHT